MMSEEIITPGFRSSEVFAKLKSSLDGLPKEKKEKLTNQVDGILEFYVMTNEAKTETFTIDLKNEGSIIKGKSPKSPNAIVSIRDVDFVDLAKGKINGQKAITSGRIKVKGQVLLANKLDTVFKQLSGNKAKL